MKRVVPDGFEKVVDESLPPSAGADRQEAFEHAIALFRARGSNPLAQRDAIKNLGDLLEEVRPQLKAALTSKDERDLFEMLNRFGLRHRDARQQTRYDPDVFLPLLFYAYLAAVHAAFRLLARASETRDLNEPPELTDDSDDVSWR